MTSPVLLPAGHVVVHADMAAYENLTAVWTDYSSSLTWTASVNPAIGNGTITARYIQVGKLVMYEGVIAMGSTTTFGTGTWTISLPVAANGTIGTTTAAVACYDNDSSTAHRPGATLPNNSTSVTLLSTTGNMDSLDPFTWAANDKLRWMFIYEAA